MMGMHPEDLKSKIATLRTEVEVSDETALGPFSENYVELAIAALHQAERFAALAHIAFMRKE